MSLLFTYSINRFSHDLAHLILSTLSQELVPVHTKIELVNKLSLAGLPLIEVTSFVSPKWVPQVCMII